MQLHLLSQLQAVTVAIAVVVHCLVSASARAGPSGKQGGRRKEQAPESFLPAKK